jgi:N-acetyl-gamma-glutamyl-phosphate/LysW-gamma-L-alpha-aminoadipyl-6-phosphate reductase
MTKKRVAIIGGTGYGGSELLRLLLSHPGVELTRVTSRQHAGKPVHVVHPHLYKVTDLKFDDADPTKLADGTDVVFSALPHGTSAEAIMKIPEGPAVIDLSGDFRLKDAAAYNKAYNHVHPAPERLKDYAYGLTEFNRETIRATRYVANPGCFATAALLATMPLAKEKLLDAPVTLIGVTGSSGSGADPKATTHHPERAEAFRAYKPLTHQHLPEIEQLLRSATDVAPQLSFVPHSAPLVRGIHMTAVLHPKSPVPAATVHEIFSKYYEKERFIRLTSQPPDVAVVAGSNHADVNVTCDGRAIVVLVALDNLVKGMAGQAVQNMNLLLGFPEDEGLRFPGMRP